MQNTLQSAFGSFALNRFPAPRDKAGKQEPLRAWDAADELLLNHVESLGLPEDSRALVVNDTFGALALSLNSRFTVSSWGDSVVSREALKANGIANNIEATAIDFTPSTQTPKQQIDLVVIKVPRSLALLEDQLFRLRAVLTDNTVIVAAAMTKMIHNNTTALFTKIIGHTTTSLAVKKARMIHPQIQRECWQAESPYPTDYALTVGENALHMCNWANVFSREKLDIGASLMLQHLPDTRDCEALLDLGCGNGILGIASALQAQPKSLTFVDESFHAVESASTNATRALGAHDNMNFLANYQLPEHLSNSQQVIINNPPFHAQNASHDQVAWAMFTDARRCLTPGGELRIVGNQHLGYHGKLKRLFGNATIIAANKKFVIISAKR